MNTGMPAPKHAAIERPVAPEDVRGALERVLASEAFRGAPQLSAFLAYIVEAMLDGRQREIKGYTIATEAFGRDASFDPQADPIVRVEAMRLRRGLDAYYGEEGAHDPLRIVVPRGSYVPAFSWRDTAEVAAVAPPAPDLEHDQESGRESEAAAVAEARGAAPSTMRRWAWGLSVPVAAALVIVALAAAQSLWPATHAPAHIAAGEATSAPAFATGERASLPTIEVLPIEISSPLPDWFSAEAFADRLLHALARFDEVLVVNRTALPDMTGAAVTTPGGRYELSLRLHSGEGVTAAARLTDAASGEVVWAGEPPAVEEGQGAEFDLARDIATTLGQPYGVVFADVRTRATSPPFARCLVSAYDYWPKPTAAQHLAVRECLEAAVAADPALHLAHAGLAYSAIEEHRSGFNKRPGPPLDRALAAAQHSVLLAPESARAQQALMTALFARGDTEAALAAGQEAIERNPFDSDILASLGSRYIAVGRYDEGLPLMERAYEQNSVRPPWYHFSMFLAAHMRGEEDRARRFAERLTGGDYPLGLVARVIAAQAAGDNQARSEALRRLLEIAPEAGADPSALFTRRSFAPEIVERLTEDLRRAGLERRA